MSRETSKIVKMVVLLLLLCLVFYVSYSHFKERVALARCQEQLKHYSDLRHADFCYVELVDSEGWGWRIRIMNTTVPQSYCWDGEPCAECDIVKSYCSNKRTNISCSWLQKENTCLCGV